MFRIYVISDKDIPVDVSTPTKELKIREATEPCTFASFVKWFPNRLTHALESTHAYARVFAADTSQEMYKRAIAFEDAGHTLVFATHYINYDNYEIESRTGKYVESPAKRTMLTHAGYSREQPKLHENGYVDFKSGDIDIEHKTQNYHHVYSNKHNMSLTIYHDPSFTLWVPIERRVIVELSHNYLAKTCDPEIMTALKLISPVEALACLPNGRLPFAAEIEERLESIKKEAIDQLSQHTANWL